MDENNIDWKINYIYEEGALKGLNEMFRTIKAHLIRAERAIENNPLTVTDVLNEQKKINKEGE